MRINHVVWDWNGTLLDDLALCVDILNQMLSFHALSRISVEEYRENFTFPVSKFYQSLNLPFQGRPYERLSDSYIEEYRKRFRECKLHGNALSVMRKLQAMGVGQSILSAGMTSDVEDFANYFNVESFLVKISGSSNVRAAGKSKIVGRHLSDMGFPADKVLFVGDTLHDFQISCQAGCECALFVGGHVSAERLKKRSCKTIENLNEVVDIVGV